MLSQIEPQAPLLVCPPVNSFKFQPCDHTPPEAQTLFDFSIRCWRSPISFLKILWAGSWSPASFYTPRPPAAHLPKDFSLRLSLQSLVGIVYCRDYDGIWSSSIPQLSFLINENIFVECFRFSLSWIGHRISPLAIKYKPPQLFLLITCWSEKELDSKIIFMIFSFLLFSSKPWLLAITLPLRDLRLSLAQCFSFWHPSLSFGWASLRNQYQT